MLSQAGNSRVQHPASAAMAHHQPGGIVISRHLAPYGRSLDAVHAEGTSIPIAKTQYVEQKYFSENSMQSANKNKPQQLAKCPSGGTPAKMSNLQSSGLQIASCGKSPVPNEMRKSTNMQIWQQKLTINQARHIEEGRPPQNPSSTTLMSKKAPKIDPNTQTEHYFQLPKVEKTGNNPIMVKNLSGSQLSDAHTLKERSGNTTSQVQMSSSQSMHATEQKMVQGMHNYRNKSKDSAKNWHNNLAQGDARLTQWQAFAMQADAESKGSSSQTKNQLEHSKVAVGKIKELRSNSGKMEIPQFISTCESARNPCNMNQTQTSIKKRTLQQRISPHSSKTTELPSVEKELNSIRQSKQDFYNAIHNNHQKLQNQTAAIKMQSPKHQQHQQQQLAASQQQNVQNMSHLFFLTPQQHQLLQQQLLSQQHQIEQLKQSNLDLTQKLQQQVQATTPGKTFGKNSRLKRPSSVSKRKGFGADRVNSYSQSKTTPTTNGSSTAVSQSNHTHGGGATFSGRLESQSPIRTQNDEHKAAEEEKAAESETSDIDTKQQPGKDELKSDSKPSEEQKVTQIKTIVKLQKNELLTRSEMALKRKYLNINRWNCISRPQYQKSCGITSLTACWNYLFSHMGEESAQARKPLLTQDQALEILGFVQPFDEIRFGPFSGNTSILRWFNQLCKHFGVKGQARIFYKPRGSKNVTSEHTPQSAWKALKVGLMNPNRAYIYHCYNHYMCPVGYEEMPLEKHNVFKKDLEHGKDTESWMVLADQAKSQPTFTCLKWSDVLQDLNMENPEFLDVRNLNKGVQTKENIEDHKRGKNCHCILEFSACRPRERKKPIVNGSAENNQARSRPIFI